MGEMFGPYEVIRKLASGGMAEVMLCKQRGIGDVARVVCVKRILPHLSENEDFIKMFQDEARIVANLIHPNIAQIYDVGTHSGDHYIAMEYVHGEDVRKIYNQEVRRDSTMPFTVAAHIMAGLLAGLDYAHRQVGADGRPLGIVHRDVTPQNILITYDGYVKIIDFGVAKAAGKIMQTRSGVLKGKYSYMAPEQAAGEPVDARADVFAAGIVLYEITTGSRLFKREGEVETLQAAIACKVPPPSEVVQGYDKDLEKIVLKALQKDKAKRYQTAGEFEDALLVFLRKHGYTPTASVLGAYMQELFADVLADHLLQGMAEEPNTRVPVSFSASKKHSSVSQTRTGTPSSTQNNDDPWASFSETRVGSWDAQSVVALAPVLPDESKAKPVVQPPPPSQPSLVDAPSLPPRPHPSENSTSGLRMRVPVTPPPAVVFFKRLFAGLLAVGVWGLLGWGAYLLWQGKKTKEEPSMPYVVYGVQEPARWTVLTNTWAWVQWGDHLGVEIPLQIHMPPGMYDVVFECPGGARQRERVWLEPDLETRTFVHCEPLHD